LNRPPSDAIGSAGAEGKELEFIVRRIDKCNNRAAALGGCADEDQRIGDRSAEADKIKVVDILGDEIEPELGIADAVDLASSLERVMDQGCNFVVVRGMRLKK
jgi:hypothetical protein